MPYRDVYNGIHKKEFSPLVGRTYLVRTTDPAFNTGQRYSGHTVKVTDIIYNEWDRGDYRWVFRCVVMTGPNGDHAFGPEESRYIGKRINLYWHEFDKSNYCTGIGRNPFKTALVRSVTGCIGG